MADDNNPTVTLAQPQTDAALKIKDPSSVDDVATYHYDPSKTGFSLITYGTYIQDTVSTNNPGRFPGGDILYAPTTSPFILELTGTGFDISTQTTEPLKVYAIIDGYIAVVPPLPSSTNLKTGSAFGYVVKSATKVWIYFSRLTFQKIWFSYDPDTFDGTEDPNKIQLESATGKYPLLGQEIAVQIQVAVNSGLSFGVNYFTQDVNNFKNLSVDLTQSPYIITLQGRYFNGATYPNVEGTPDDIQQLVFLYGHNLLHEVMMVKKTSTLLTANPSAIPQNVLSAVQDDAAVASLKAQDLAALEYFKVGHFLEGLESYVPTSTLTNYTYRAADGTHQVSGKTGTLPGDSLSIVKFEIDTMPAGVYDVVIFDATTGDYDVAPVPITINLSTGTSQIHDISPSTVVLQSPTFTVNGFNFPTQDDIANGARFTVSLVDSNQQNAVPNQGISALFTNAFLQIDQTSPTNSKNGIGSIGLISNSQFVAKFTNLHVADSDIQRLGTDTTFRLYVETIYQNPNPAQGKVNQAIFSNVLQIQSQPIISYLTNNTTALPPNMYQKSLVRVDQATGNVIAFGVPEKNLYIIGKNFTTTNSAGKLNPVSVFIQGVQQKVLSVGAWQNDPTLNSIIVNVNPANIKGDASIEVRVGTASSEAYQLTLSVQPSATNIVTDAKGKHTNAQQTIDVSDFKNILPYNQLDQITLLNSNNTKVASSVALSLVNKQSKSSVSLTANLNTSVALPFLPDQITVPANTQLASNGQLNVTFYFYNLYNVNISTPKIFRLQHDDSSYGGIFKQNEKMTVVGTGFVNGMRYNINNNGWTIASPLSTATIPPTNGTIYQTFTLIVPASKTADASLQISNDQANQVASASSAGKSSGAYKVSTIVVNDRYSPLLQINQRLPAGIKMYAKGPQIAMTDKIDANMSIYSQMTPFLGSFKTLLIIIRIIVCIIDVICALINPFQLIVAIIALMDCIIDLLSLFPQLAVPIMILSFLQNFIGFLQTFILQIEAYVFSIVNSQLALVKAQISQDFALLAAAEQQAFGATKQIRDAISFLEPALQIIQIFKDLLAFAMHFPCAGNQGGTQNNGNCPPANIQSMANNSTLKNLVDGVDDLGGTGSSMTLQTMFCQAVSLQTSVLQTMPGFSSGALTPGSTSVIPTITPTLPNVSAAIECMNNYTDQIESALDAGQTFITTEAQGQALVAAYTQCVQNLLDQTNQGLGDICGLAVSALNSELKVSPKGRIGPDVSDDFIRTKIALPSTDPNSIQDSGLTLDLAQLTSPAAIPASISTDPATGTTGATQNFGTKQDIYTPIIFQSTNASGQRQSPTTIYFNADNSDVGGLISVGDILEIVGSPFSGLQFPIIGIEQIFTAVRLTCKLDITFEQKLLVGEQPLPENLSGFDVKIIAHLAGNDAVAVVSADDISVATLQILARDHHGHEIGPGLANNIAVNIESGTAEFVPITPSSTTDVTGVIQESGTHYIANLKSNCAGTVIISSSVCDIEFVDIGYHANDPNHAITTRKKTVKIIFTPPIPKPGPLAFEGLQKGQVPGTEFVN